MKTCRRCGRSKPIGDFYIGYTSCKECAKQHAREVYAAGTSATRSYDGGFEASLKRLHGMTLADYDRMSAAQDGRCAVCRQPETVLRRNGQPYRLAVDHDHRTGRGRALLCRRCTQIVRAFDEHAGLFDAVRHYLDRSGPAPLPGRPVDG
jgi:hypothetical protein